MWYCGKILLVHLESRSRRQYINSHRHENVKFEMHNIK
jgi:hypothetical protein